MTQKPENYYSWARHDLLNLLPLDLHPEAVLDVGCGAGATGNVLKMKYRANHVTGIEFDRRVAETAREKIDFVITGNAETVPLPFSSGQFDLILMGDVLEHLIDPWKTLEKYKTFLKPSGYLLASIPNVQHWRTVMNLFFGHWEYKEGGTLDKTHLRFFTKKSIIRLFDEAGFTINKIHYNMGPEVKIINNITLRIMKNILTYQYLVLAQK